MRWVLLVLGLCITPVAHADGVAWDWYYTDGAMDFGTFSQAAPVPIWITVANLSTTDLLTGAMLSGLNVSYGGELQPQLNWRGWTQDYSGSQDNTHTLDALLLAPGASQAYFLGNLLPGPTVFAGTYYGGVSLDGPEWIPGTTGTYFTAPHETSGGLPFLYHTQPHAPEASTWLLFGLGAVGMLGATYTTRRQYRLGWQSAAAEVNNVACACGGFCTCLDMADRILRHLQEEV